MNGILILDKPAGWTSHDCVAKLRGLLGQRRIGHAGTLDPMATGVLAVFVGRATRAVQFSVNDEKEYIAGMRLGLITDTQDVTGTTLETRPVTCGKKEVAALLPRFIGQQAQLPPMYSAIKIKGQRLYTLARKGVEAERAPRTIEIKALELLDSPDGDCLLRVVCSKGTYIRTLCHDMGQALGCGAALSSLRRVRAGCFSLADAVTLADIEQEQADRSKFLLPVDTLFQAYPAVSIQGEAEWRYRNGQRVPLTAGAPGHCRVYSGDSGTFLTLGQITRTDARLLLGTVKSFF